MPSVLMSLTYRTGFCAPRHTMGCGSRQAHSSTRTLYRSGQSGDGRDPARQERGAGPLGRLGLQV